MPPPPCDPLIPPAARIFGLPSTVRTGREELFGFEQTFASDWDARLPVDVKVVDAKGQPFFHGRVRRFDDEILYVRLDLGGDRSVGVRASYVEASLDTRRARAQSLGG